MQKDQKDIYQMKNIYLPDVFEIAEEEDRQHRNFDYMQDTYIEVPLKPSYDGLYHIQADQLCGLMKNREKEEDISFSKGYRRFEYIKFSMVLRFVKYIKQNSIFQKYNGLTDDHIKGLVTEFIKDNGIHYNPSYSPADNLEMLTDWVNTAKTDIQDYIKFKIDEETIEEQQKDVTRKISKFIIEYADSVDERCSKYGISPPFTIVKVLVYQESHPVDKYKMTYDPNYLRRYLDNIRDHFDKILDSEIEKRSGWVY